MLLLRAHNALALTIVGLVLSVAIGLLATQTVGTIANPSYRTSMAAIAPALTAIVLVAMLHRGLNTLRRLSPRPMWLIRLALVNTAFIICLAGFALTGEINSPEVAGSGIRNFIGLFGIAMASSVVGAYYQWIFPFASVAVPFLGGIANDGSVRIWAWVLQPVSASSSWYLASMLFVLGNGVVIAWEAILRR